MHGGADPLHGSDLKCGTGGTKAMCIWNESVAMISLCECRLKAQEINGESWFFAKLPSGAVKCTWLDPFMGIIRIHTPSTEDGFVMDNELQRMFINLECTEPCKV